MENDNKPLENNNENDNQEIEINIVDDGAILPTDQNNVNNEQIAQSTPAQTNQQVQAQPEQVQEANTNPTPQNPATTVQEVPKVEMPKLNNQDQVQSGNIGNVKESQSQTIGKIKPDKQKSPVAMLVLFLVLIVFMLFMPPILSFVNQTFNLNIKIPNVNNNNNNSNNNNNNNNKPSQEEIKMYDLSESTSIEMDKLVFNDFRKASDVGYKLAFEIKNTGLSVYKFEKKLYIEFYNDNKTFIGRSYLENLKEVSSGAETTYIIDINEEIFNNASKIELIQRTEDDYPNITITDGQLTCTNATTNLVYTFDSDQKLTTIKDMYTYTKTEDELSYNSDLVVYKSKMDSLNENDGVTATLSETDSGFITTIYINYASADYQKISSNKNYYIKDTYAKTISFEMNAKGFTCR